jgi:hypothetical protein
LGSATLRGHYAGGVYQPPAKSLITSAQLAEIKVCPSFRKSSFSGRVCLRVLFTVRLLNNLPRLVVHLVWKVSQQPNSIVAFTLCNLCALLLTS